MIHNSLKYLSQTNIGSNINYSCGVILTLDKGSKVFGPRSNEVSNSSANKQNISLDKQGFYTIKKDNEASKYVAVNSVREKNELLNKESLNDFKFIDPDVFANNNIFSVERNNYSFIFLYALIILVILEMVIARKL